MYEIGQKLHMHMKTLLGETKGPTHCNKSHWC